MAKELKVLFIGSFPKVSKGGISTANKLLIPSEAFAPLKIFKIDSTLRNIRNNLWVERVLRAIGRFLKITWILIVKRPDVGLIFCGHGSGFIEKGSYVLYSRLFGLKCVLAPRSGIIMRDLKRPWFRVFARRVFKSSGFVICQGQYWKRIFTNYCDPDKLVVIHNWLQLPDKKINCEQEMDKSPFQLLYMGWFEHYKGLTTILQAALELHKKGEDFVLDLHGEGSIRREIQSYIQDNGLENKVFIHGWISGAEKEEAFLNSSTMLIASKFEGMPNVLLEAMSYGLPVIANGITSIPEIIRHKENGLLFYGQNLDDLVIQIQSLISNRSLCKKLSRNARKQIEEYHQVEFAASKIVHLLETVAV